MQPMNTNLHQFVLDHLAARNIKWARVALERYPLETLKKIEASQHPQTPASSVRLAADYFRAQAPLPVRKQLLETVAGRGCEMKPIRPIAWRLRAHDRKSKDLSSELTALIRVIDRCANVLLRIERDGLRRIS